MSKKQMIRRRGLCGLLAMAMCIGVLPPTAGAAVTAKNDWEIFDASDTYNLPGTQEQILQEMISTGGYQMYKKEQVDIRELTGQFRERIEAAAAGKKQTIQFECENLPKWICVNEKLLIRSWENLVYNAIEYTPQGGMIRICISEGKEQLEISVEDEGSGFSAEDLQSAKNLFYQGDKSRHSRKHYGMGLYLAEQFAKENGGSLTLANSTRMKGAWVRLRIAKESQK